MRVTQQEYEQIERRLAAGRKLPAPIPQPAVCDGPLATETGEGKGSGRCAVVVTSYRCGTLTDPDNTCAKYVIDSLRYAGILYDDTPEAITLTVKQVRVKTRKEEKTVVELTPL